MLVNVLPLSPSMPLSAVITTLNIQINNNLSLLISVVIKFSDCDLVLFPNMFRYESHSRVWYCSQVHGLLLF